MATTFDELKRFMDESSLHYDADDEMEAIAVGFTAEPDDTTYRTPGTNEPTVQIIVRLVEDGEFVAVMAPQAWDLSSCEHRPAVCEAAARICSKMKQIRFDLDKENFLQPNVEFALEQAPMCSDQLHRAIGAVLVAVREFDPVIRHAMETGVVDFSLVKEERPEPPGDISQILELGDAAGGLDALEQLLGGGDTPPVQT
jgi:hypothetical protein